MDADVSFFSFHLALPSFQSFFPALPSTLTLFGAGLDIDPPIFPPWESQWFFASFFQIRGFSFWF